MVPQRSRLRHCRVHKARGNPANMRESPRRLRRLATASPVAATARGLSRPWTRRCRTGSMSCGGCGWSAASWRCCCGRCTAMPVQAVCLLLPGRPKVAFARCYWALFSRMLGVQVRVIGSMYRQADGDASGGVRLQPFVLGGHAGAWRRAGRLLRGQRRGRPLAGDQHDRMAGPDCVRLASARRNRRASATSCARACAPATT